MVIVVAAVIRDRGGRVLLARRLHGRHMGGLWEFPGGKVEPGESPPRALERELAEELGVQARCAEPITFAFHEEPGRALLLLFYDAVVEKGEPYPRDGQEVHWVSLSALSTYPMPPADEALVTRLVGLEQVPILDSHRP